MMMWLLFPLEKAAFIIMPFSPFSDLICFRVPGSTFTVQPPQQVDGQSAARHLKSGNNEDMYSLIKILYLHETISNIQLSFFNFVLKYNLLSITD